MHIKNLTTYSELIEFLSEKDSVKIFGIGDVASRLLGRLKLNNPDLLKKIACITATRVYGKPPQIYNIPVVAYEDAQIGPQDTVLLLLRTGLIQQVIGILEQTEADIVHYGTIESSSYPYQKCFQVLLPHIEAFPRNAEMLLPQPQTDAVPRVWSMWWQGEEHAPEIVKACLRSQRKNLPTGVDYTVITQENYTSYVRLPDYILEKVQSGNMLLAHLSDIIRWLLLYQYGGLWMDSTVFVVKPLSNKIIESPFYTHHELTPSFGTDTFWTMYFMAAKPGHPLFRFLATMLLEYVKNHASIMDIDYLMSDYCIGIAYNTLPEVKRDIQALPFCGVQYTLKGGLLTEPYSAEKIDYLMNSDWFKATYKIPKNKSLEGSVYEYLCKNF